MQSWIWHVVALDQQVVALSEGLHLHLVCDECVVFSRHPLVILLQYFGRDKSALLTCQGFFEVDNRKWLVEKRIQNR